MQRLLVIFIILFGSLNISFGGELPEPPQPTHTTPFFNANKAAFVTTTSLSALTALSALGAATAARTANTFGLVSYSILAIIGAGASIAAVTSWWSFGEEQATTDAGTYFEKFGEHTAMAVSGTVLFTAQILVQAVVQGLAQGTSRAISRSIGGEDQTIRITR